MDKDMVDRREKLKAQLQDKKYRDAFVSEHINEGISFQIRALRKQRGWTQKELSKRTDMAQERISVAENPNYSRFNIKTLKRIASSFDVALIVRFVPFSELVNWELNLSSETLGPVSFDEDFKPPETHIVGSGGGKVGGEGIWKFTYFAGPPQTLQTTQAKPSDELAKYREARQKKSKSQLPDPIAFMERDDETAFG